MMNYLNIKITSIPKYSPKNSNQKILKNINI